MIPFLLALTLNSDVPYYQRREDISFNNADALVLSANAAIGCGIAAIAAAVHQEFCPAV